MKSRYFDGKKILIMGAVSGRGMEIVRQLAQYKTKLFLTARSLKKMEEDLCKLKRSVYRIDTEINLAGYGAFQNFTDITDLLFYNSFVRKTLQLLTTNRIRSDT